MQSLAESASRFERGVMTFSIDTERLWGHFDLLDERAFEQRYPVAIEIHDRLLQALTAAGVRATWDVVGGLGLDACAGAADARMRGLPKTWIAAIPAGDNRSQPLWYDRAFVLRLRDALPRQEIAMHGGLTHLFWHHPECTADVAWRELEAGMQAHAELGIVPRSFVFPRDLEAHLPVLRAAGLRCYRGRAPIASENMALRHASPLLRVMEEIGQRTPVPILPQEVLPGFWNVPASASIYPMGRARARLVPLRTRLERFRRGLEAAARTRRIFHLSFHPENLAESPEAMPIFEQMLVELDRWRTAGDIEVMSMDEIVDRWEGGASDAPPALTANSEAMR